MQVLVTLGCSACVCCVAGQGGMCLAVGLVDVLFGAPFADMESPFEGYERVVMSLVGLSVVVIVCICWCIVVSIQHLCARVSGWMPHMSSWKTVCICCGWERVCSWQ